MIVWVSAHISNDKNEKANDSGRAGSDREFISSVPAV